MLTLIKYTKNMTSGKINVTVENIFPLIKKFLYSDHEIFLRELVSNATDATLKLKHLTSIGEASVTYGNPQIEVKINKENKTLHIRKNFFHIFHFPFSTKYEENSNL